MSVDTVGAVKAPARRAEDSGQGAAMRRFAVLLPVVMAVFLLLVSTVGKIAALPLLLVFVPLILWSAFADTEKAIYVLFAWCWMDGTIRGLFGGSGAIVLARDIILLLILIGWGMKRLRTRRHDPLRTPPGTVLVILFIVNALLQIANPNSFGLLCSLAGLKLHLTPIPLLFIGYDVFRTKEQARSFFLFLTLATLVISVVSIAQYLQGPGWTYAHFPGSKEVISLNTSSLTRLGHEDNLGFKPPGTTTFGGGTNAFIGGVLPAAFALLLLGKRLRFTPWGKAGLAAALFVLTIALFLNGVRSGLVSGVVGIIICSVLAGGKQVGRTLGTALLCGVIGFGAFTYSQGLSNGHVIQRYGTTLANPLDAMHADRRTFFEDVGDLAVQVPLGNGLGKVGPTAGLFGVDPLGDFTANYFSEAYLGNMILETGMSGALLITLIAVFYLGHGLVRLPRLRDPDTRLLAAVLLTVLLVLFANFFVSPILFQPPGSLLFWLGAAMLMRLLQGEIMMRKTV